MAVACVAAVNLSYELFQPLFSSCEHDLVQSGSRATVISVGALIMDMLSAGVDVIIGWASDFSLSMALISSALLIMTGMIFWMMAVSQKNVTI